FSICGQVFVLFRKIKIFLTTFNLFPSIPPSTDEHELRNQRISTRLFLVLLSASLIILLTYNSIITVTITKTIQTPSLKKYEELYETYSKTLTCPCEKMSIDYKDIVQINFTLHQVCDSDFISEKWIKHLYRHRDFVGLVNDDYLWSSPFMFQALDGICPLINRKIHEGLEQFYLNQYISTIVISSDLFESQIETFVTQLRSITTNTFVLFIDQIREMTLINSLDSAHHSNHLLVGVPDTGAPPIMNIKPNRCIEPEYLPAPAEIWKNPKENPVFRVPGIYIGCYTLMGLLASSLECFYKQSCVDKLQSYIIPPMTFRPRPLDASLKSRFVINSTMQQIINQLMIEEWNWTHKYENYYNECRPIECKYSYETESGIVYIVTATIGLIGGLLTALKIVVPFCVNVIIRKRRLETERS
ncbi:unnamed protein product, partial [Adineta ricciae]